MIRHPFYILVCLFAVGCLAVADVRGWSFLQSLTTRLTTTASGGRGSSYGSFNHK
jgi:protein-S-isoprenylcysteine O-methyltransferase Ste14